MINISNTTATNNDNDMKQFWHEAAHSMMGNFYCRYNNSMLERPIQNWTKNIETSSPEDLQETIQDYLTLFSIDVLRRQCTYTMGILGSNLKRWNVLNNTTNNSNIMFFLVDLYQTLVKGGGGGGATGQDLRVFSDVELFLLVKTKHWAALVDYAIAHRKQGALDKMRVFFEQHHQCLFDIYVHIEATYGVKLQEGMCAKKILSLICARLR